MEGSSSNIGQAYKYSEVPAPFESPKIPEILKADDSELFCYEVSESVRSDIEKAIQKYGQPAVLDNPDLILESYFSKYI